MTDDAKQGGGMAYRLGWALYWAGCIIAGLSALFGLVALYSYSVGNIPSPFGAQVILLFAVVVWLTGRGIRLVLSGD